MYLMKRDQRIRWFVPFLYLLFIVYGSFIPFHVRPILFADAIVIFSRIEFLDLGIVSRADWVANILLYFPLGFLLTGWLSRKNNSFLKKCLIFLSVVFFCISAAVSIEFFQTFFSPRSVSLNDLLAEAIGAITGIYIWFFMGPQLIRLWLSAKHDTHLESALKAFFTLYIFFLLGLALFPFDFLVSIQEIKWKYESWMSQPLLLNASVTMFVLKMIAEAALFAPIGCTVAMKYRQGSLKKIIVITVCSSSFIAFVIEILQFFTASGVSQFFSVLARVMGSISGIFIIKFILSNYLKRLKPFLKSIILIITPFYLVIVLKISGWFKEGWLSFQEGMLKFDYHMMLPFYYHYFTTETRAVLSTLFVFCMYAPIGFSAWLLYIVKPRDLNRYASLSISFSMILSILIETGKLFKTGLHPDYTNTLIAVFSAVVVYNFSDRIFSLFYPAFNE